MKFYIFLLTTIITAGWVGGGFAALVGSNRSIVQENFQHLIKTNECPGCDLAGIVLTRVDLTGANLEGANLAGAKLNLSNLSKANLMNANLQGAELGGTDFAGADLRGANLTGAVLGGAYFKGALLDGELVAEKPYVADGLPEVTEVRYQDEQSRGKHLPYTTDPAQENVPDDAPAEPVAAVQETVETPPEPDVKTEEIMTVSVVEEQIDEEEAVETKEPSPASPAAEAIESVPVEQNGDGLWGSVTSFFSGEPTAEEEPDAVNSEEPVDNKKTAKTIPVMAEAIVEQATIDEAVVQEIVTEVRTPADEIVINETIESTVADIQTEDPEPVTPVVENIPAEPSVEPEELTEAVQEEKAEEGGFWNSVTSVFSSEEESPPASAASEQAVETVSTPAPGETLYTVATPEQANIDQQLLIEQLFDRKGCVACDLAGVDLSDRNLDGFDLERANLQGANLEEADLNEANLKGTNLSGANLKNADLREADLYLADFSNADLTGARLSEAMIDSTDFTGAVGVNLEGTLVDE